MAANAPERRRLARAMVILGAAIATSVEKRNADTCDDGGFWNKSISKESLMLRNLVRRKMC